MRPSFLQQYLPAFRRIHGWFDFDAALLFMQYNQLARADGGAGNVLEIGVHHGLSAIAIASLRGPGSQLTAVDLFKEKQRWNISASGSGDRAKFESNLREYHPDLSFLRTLAEPSTELSSAKLGNGFTFCHIDGGHSPEETYSDLRLCWEISSPGGLIALDDYFNPGHPGVCEGAVAFSLKNPGALQPLVIGYNKVIFQKPETKDPKLNKAFLKRFPEIRHQMVTMWNTPAVLMLDSLRDYIDIYSSTPARLVRLRENGPRAAIRVKPRHLKARPGERVELEVEVKNVSSEAFPGGEGVFGVSYHLLEKSGAMLVYDNPGEALREPLLPGESITVKMAVAAPAQPGEYQLEFDLVWEKVMWFKEIANPTAIVPLHVH